VQDGGVRRAAIWVALAVLFLALGLLAPLALTLPEWTGVGICDGSCDGSWDAYGALGAALGGLCTVVGICILAGVIILTPPGRTRQRSACAPAPHPLILPREIAAARQAPPPDVFARWVARNLST